MAHPYAKHKDHHHSRAKGRTVYKAEGGEVGDKVYSIDTPAGAGFPPKPDDNAGRMASARTTSQEAVQEERRRRGMK